MLLSKYAVCDSKKSKFIKDQETSGLLRSLGRKTPLSEIPLQMIFCFKSIKQINTDKMNEMRHKFLLTGDTCMPKCI